MNSQYYRNYSCFFNIIFIIPNDLNNYNLKNETIYNDFNQKDNNFNCSENAFPFSFENIKFLSYLKNNWKNSVKKSIFISKYNLMKKIYCY